ncbi:hypothetical protein [Sporichthya brevicatena]|uniref:hypothetical protein n=1 Tax=Sporichthya brevicatena TaxID=171442 RepID=UPI0031D6BF6E
MRLAGGLGVIGAIGLVFCWWGGSGERTFEDGKDWVVGAVVAAALIILAAVHLLLRGFRRLREAKDDAVNRLLIALPPVAVHFEIPAERPRPVAELAPVSEVALR